MGIKIKEKISNLLIYIGIYSLRILLNILNIFPIRNNRIMFYSFNGKKYSDNPQIISEYLAAKHQHLELVWAFKNPDDFSYLLSQGIKTVKFRSLKYYFYAKTSHVVVFNVQGYGELARRKNQVFVQTWHASTGYKKVSEAVGIRRTRLLLGHKDYSYVLSGSKSMTARRIRKSMAFEGPVIEGTPRMDMIVNQNNSSIIEQIKTKYGIPENYKIILYAPTWRRNGQDAEIMFDVPKITSAFEKRFGSTWKLLVHLHPNVQERVNNTDVIDATDYQEMEELLYAADALITDYSSCIWDYSFAGKPSFLYCYDLDMYEKNKSFDIPIEEWGFSISTNEDQLISNIKSFDYDQYKYNVEKHHKLMGSLEDGRATERVCHVIERTMGLL